MAKDFYEQLDEEAGITTATMSDYAALDQEAESEHQGIISTATSLTSRFGKQLWNTAVAVPAHVLSKGGDPGEIAAWQAQQKRIAKRTEIGEKPFTSELLDDEFEDIVRQLRQYPSGARDDDDLQALPQYARPITTPALAAEVEPAAGLPEKIVDVGAGLTGFIAQLAVARQILPVGTPTPIIWETVNLSTGGQPGQGAAMAATLGMTAKIPAVTTLGKAGRMAVESGVFGGLEAAAGGTPEDIAIQALIPPTLRGIGFAKTIPTRMREIAARRTIEPALPIPTETRPVPPAGIEAPTSPRTETMGFEQVRSELTTGLKITKRLARGEIARGYSAERAKRAADFEAYKDDLIAQGVPVSEALKRAQVTLGGPLLEQTPTYKPPILRPEQWESISNEIEYSGKFRTYEKLRAQNALDGKLKQGKPLQDNEIELLSRILGADFAKAAQKLQPWQVRMWRGFEDVMNFWKIGASFDVQMRRQARWLRARHPILFGKAVWKNVAGYFSKKAADRITLDYTSDPLHEQARADGVVFLERPAEAGLAEVTPLGRKPEFFRTTIPYKIPVVGRAYRASQRGFVEGFNWMQQKLYSYKYNHWLQQGREITPEMRTDLVDFNNTILGLAKPKTDFGAKARRTMSMFMWSPTLTWSRVRTPGMILTNPTMRGEVAATLASYIGSGLIAMYAAKKFGIGEVEFDPRSTDFGKIKIGTTRFDVFGDGGPYIRAVAGLIAGQKKTQAGKIIEYPRAETIANFLRSKRAAFIDFAWRVSTGKTYFGGPVWQLPEWEEMKKEKGWRAKVAEVGERLTATSAGKIAFLGGREIFNTFAPFFVEATIEACYNDGLPVGLLAGTEEFFSGTTLSYKPTKSAQLQMLKDAIADLELDRDWDDLGPREQERLRRQYRVEIEPMEQEVEVERGKRLDYEFVGRMIAEEKKAGRNVYKLLNPELQRAIEGAGVPEDLIGLSRKIGDWVLNDERYKRYQDLTAESINKELARSVKRSGWARMTQQEKEQEIRDVVNMAKGDAREKLIREARKPTTETEKGWVSNLLKRIGI